MLSNGEMNISCCEATPPGSELNIEPKSCQVNVSYRYTDARTEAKLTKDASSCVPEPGNALSRYEPLNMDALISGIGDGSRGMLNGSFQERYSDGAALEGRRGRVYRGGIMD